MSKRLFYHAAICWLGLLVVIAGTQGFSASGKTREVLAQVMGNRIYLPLVMNDHPRSTIFGVNVAGVADPRVASSLESARTGWVRSVNYLLWKDVQPTADSAYNWNAPSVQRLERDMIAAAQKGINLIVIVHGTPGWATVHQSDCAPINPDRYGDFAQFVAAAVARYDQAPYNVTFWEIGNEPDAPIMPSDSVFGCWGVEDDPYYGGRAYGDLLKVVYPIIKSVNPNAQVLNGGLLLDAPPSPMTMFIDGIFAAGAGGSFDILSYHSYSWDNGTPDGTLGRTDWKVAFLRDRMVQWGVPEKPMMNTEAALLCSVACPERRADIVGRMYARAIRDGVEGYLWYIYDSDSFFNTALIEPDNPSVARPAQAAFRHASLLLGGMEYQGPITDQPASVEGYHFRRGGRSISIVWSDTPQTISLRIPASTITGCTNRSGAPVGCSGSGNTVTLAIGTGPTYIEGR